MANYGIRETVFRGNGVYDMTFSDHQIDLKELFEALYAIWIHRSLSSRRFGSEKNFCKTDFQIPPEVEFFNEFSSVRKLQKRIEDYNVSLASLCIHNSSSAVGDIRTKQSKLLIIHISKRSNGWQRACPLVFPAFPRQTPRPQVALPTEKCFPSEKL